MDEQGWAGAVPAVVERFGRLDVLVNNAGISDHSLVESTSVEEWDRMMAVNAKGVFLGTRTAIPEMRKAGGGSIVNTSSQLGLVGVDTSSPQYQASKGAVRLLMKATVRRGGDPGQLRSPWPHCDAPERRALPCPSRAGGALGLSRASRQARPARGGGLRDVIPCLGRVVLRDGQRACDRRGLDGAVKLSGVRNQPSEN